MLEHARGYFSVLGTAFVLASCATATTPQDISGTYEVSRESGVITNAQAEAGECPAGSIEQDVGFCVEPTTATDTLTVTEQSNDNLSFDVFVNGFNGHSCGMSGVAAPTGPQSWRIEKPNEYSDAICKVDIIVEDGTISFRQDYDAGSDCSAYCGNRIQMGGSFPLSSLKR